MSQLGPDELARGIAASSLAARDGSPVWWSAVDEGAMFARWEASLDRDQAKRDGSTTAYLRDWAAKLRPACSAGAAAGPAVPSFACAATELPGTPGPTRPHTFCHGRAGGALLNLAALEHADCLPSRPSHKCPGEYGVSGSAPLPLLLDGTAPPGSAFVDGPRAAGQGPEEPQGAGPGETPPGDGGPADDRGTPSRFAPARAPSLAALGDTTFVTLAGCSHSPALLAPDAFSADWWRDVVLRKAAISSIADPPAELRPPAPGVAALLVARDPADHANLFHTVTAVQSALSALHMAGVVDLADPATWGPGKRRIAVVVVDTLPPGPFDEIWSRAFAPHFAALRPLRPKLARLQASAEAAELEGVGGTGAAAARSAAESLRSAVEAHEAMLGSDPGGSAGRDWTVARHGLAAIVPAEDHPALARVVSRPEELVVPPPAYASTMFAYVNTRMPLPPQTVRSPVYRAMGLWLQQGSRSPAKGWRADRPGDGPEMRLDAAAQGALLQPPGPPSQGPPLCVAGVGIDGGCAYAVPRGRVRVLVILRRPYARFVEHKYMSRMWADEAGVAAAAAAGLGLPGAGPPSGEDGAPVGMGSPAAGQVSEMEAIRGRAELQFLDQAHLSWEEQMAMLAGTDVLVGVHGAALTAAALLPPWASLVEVRPKADTWFCFEYMSVRCGIEYFPLRATKSTKLPDNKGDAVEVDPEAFGSTVRRAALKAMHRRRQHVLEAAAAGVARH